MRTAQRNLNKILLGDGDDNDSLGDSTNCSTSSKASMLKIGTILEHSRTPIVSNHGQGDYCVTLKKDPSTSAASTSSSSSQQQPQQSHQQQQQLINGSTQSHIVDNDKLPESNMDALKNDVKLNQYPMYNNYFLQNQQMSNTNQINDLHQNYQPLHQHEQHPHNVDRQNYDNDDSNATTSNNNNNKGVRNALMSEIGSLSPLNHIMPSQEAVGMYHFDYVLSLINHYRTLIYLFSFIHHNTMFIYTLFIDKLKTIKMPLPQLSSLTKTITYAYNLKLTNQIFNISY